MSFPGYLALRGYHCPDSLAGLSTLANLGTFHEFKVAVTTFFKDRERERLAAIAGGIAAYETFSEVDYRSQLLFVCLTSAVDDKAKCTYLIEASVHMRFVSARGKKTLLARAVESGKPALVRLLLDHNAVVEGSGIAGGDQPVCLAVECRDKTAGISMLKHFHEYSANFQVTNKAGRTPFELAVMQDDHAMVKFIAKVGGATNLASVAERVINNCTKELRCNRLTCNPAMLLLLVDLGAEVRLIKRDGLPPTKFDGTVHMCFESHRDFDYVLRKRFEDTKFVLMMGLFSKQKGLESFEQVNVLDEAVCTKIFMSVLCDRERHPLVIQDGALVESKCSLRCGRHVKDPKFPFSVLSVPRTQYVFAKPHVEDKDARFPTEAELAEAARIEAEEIWV
jgi:hypothetical protein